LIHPNKTGSISELKFSLDCKRISAANSPGLVAVWDVATGEQLTTIETGCRNFAVSPDGRTPATDGHSRILLWDMTKMPE
jgi:WD40 repeat protein